MSYDIANHWNAIQKLMEEGVAFVSVTLVDIRGSAPQIIGAKAIVSSDGIEMGTVGGGKVEAAAIQHAQQLISDPARRSELVVWNLQTDIGMTCGGEVKLFFEVFSNSAWPIIVFGAGHVSQALIRVLVQLDCQLTCVDSRSDWLEKLPRAAGRLRTICVEHPCEVVAGQLPNAFFVLMSKGHATDLPVLAEILSTREAPYVGVIGSKQKASVLRRDLARMGIAADKIASFHCPMGLPIGNNTPAEIAISITAQLLQVREAVAHGRLI